MAFCGVTTKAGEGLVSSCRHVRPFVTRELSPGYSESLFQDLSKYAFAFFAAIFWQNLDIWKTP